ncbi:dihydroorotase [Polaribacter sp.]|nr:dihydroorotase [Polaribacter sp.]
MTTLIKSALIFDSESSYHLQKKDILIVDGIIKSIENTIESKADYNIVEKENLHVSCGWFDSSVCFGEPGFEERETISHGLQVAAKSGFTAIAVNSNTKPVIDNTTSVSFLKNKALNNATKLYPIACLTQECKGKEMAELYDMQQNGAVAFGDYKKAIENDNLLKVALLYAQNFNGLVLSFPKNNAISGNGVAHEGKNSTLLGLKGIPALAEHIQIARDLFLLEYTGGKLHIPTISTEKSVQLIKEAKNKGLQVTCSVASHHLFLTDDELHGFDSNYKTNPPLRTKKDTTALQKAVEKGIIDCVTSDHNPKDIEEKKVEFSIAEDGTIGLESCFGVANAVLDLSITIKSLTTKGKSIFGIENHTIKEGNIAELTFFNPEKKYTFSKEDILSTSKNSAFLGKELKGIAYGVFANNQLISK